MLQEAMSKLDPEVSVGLCQKQLSFPIMRVSSTGVIVFFLSQEGKYHLKRCIDSGLWVPESGGECDDEDSEGGEED